MVYSVGAGSAERQLSRSMLRSIQSKVAPWLTMSPRTLVKRTGTRSQKTPLRTQVSPHHRLGADLPAVSAIIGRCPQKLYSRHSIHRLKTESWRVALNQLYPSSSSDLHPIAPRLTDQWRNLSPHASTYKHQRSSAGSLHHFVHRWPKSTAVFPWIINTLTTRASRRTSLHIPWPVPAAMHHSLPFQATSASNLCTSRNCGATPSRSRESMRSISTTPCQHPSTPMSVPHR